MTSPMLPFSESLAHHALTVAARAEWLAEQQRRDTHCWRILGLLRSGRRTNRELNAVSFDYRRRVSDLRERGYVIQCRKSEQPGLTYYTLEVEE